MPAAGQRAPAPSPFLSAAMRWALGRLICHTLAPMAAAYLRSEHQPGIWASVAPSMRNLHGGRGEGGGVKQQQAAGHTGCSSSSRGSTQLAAAVLVHKHTTSMPSSCQAQPQQPQQLSAVAPPAHVHVALRHQQRKAAHQLPHQPPGRLPAVPVEEGLAGKAGIEQSKLHAGSGGSQQQARGAGRLLRATHKQAVSATVAGHVAAGGMRLGMLCGMYAAQLQRIRVLAC